MFLVTKTQTLKVSTLTEYLCKIFVHFVSVADLLKLYCRKNVKTQSLVKNIYLRWALVLVVQTYICACWTNIQD